ncbi:hypothetical protein E6P09_14095 [Haloferax mediterranei ATCC 33500]|uniref:DUF7115 domain-containing protein n=1 Tax=Haloferax mediterranei (strain ATCC 33500 / DSM 1411 / JCM 8866 / NBRC 14739 / NCIMB 2177 / R-4) TaxID=523841 RepID=I3R7K4_HALMT|nr:hypothetical protein [Haloferax mediterranei]AFK20214.1 hypothetical protein HFX_2532 [Haloferax mediterranei ATCC 33500]AHZ23589.1 hypothetical protein BM92_13490 [Haloferax mediterranei ATCC 33500]ELZ99073.1 hypothetical protein C439_14479 [Haloferax mediterranei ATCC 33500]MDX5987029.1 hypothetical protein [Haloferax mediterranei ATCC 33500]QCQ76347.1 hypothetical protein E6P09_14095 [Haloferax mediterranei ATCC 33500]
MSQPEIVQSVLGEEDVVTRVHLGGEDELFVTPTRTLVYRAEGLLSDESVDEFSHGAERLSVSEGRRKAKISLDYGLDGSETFSLSAKRLDDALQPIVGGVLAAAGVTDEGESVIQTFRFSELTFAVTDARVVRHIGSAVWDEDYESYHYSDVSDLEFESGSVATTVVLTVDGRQERFKIPNEEARLVREKLAQALCEYHGVGSLEEFRVKMAEQAEAEAETEQERDNTDFGAGPDPLSANPGELSDEPANATRTENDEPTESPNRQPVEAASTAGSVSETQSVTSEPDNVADASDLGFEGSGFESATESDGNQADLAAEIESLREVVEAQNEQLHYQQELIEQLINELRRGR